MTDAYYEPLGGGRYRPTEHVQGAWRADEQHMAPVGGLLVHAIETHAPREDLQPARVTFDILGVIPLRDSLVEVRTLRPGRTIELVEATLSVDGRAAVRATAWRLQRADTAAVQGGSVDGAPPMPAPDTLTESTGLSAWGGGFIASLSSRRSADSVPGRARSWVRSDITLLPEPVSATASFARLVDTANGLNARVDPQEWMFPNVDLTIHLFREPVGEWVGIDGHQVHGATGVGLTSSTLHDVLGPVGRAEQCLTVRPVPPGGL